MGTQLDLFAPEPAPSLDFADEQAIAARLPDSVLFGTSSWTFPGWAGIVYPGRPSERQLVERGLELYVRYPLFRTVGIDRSYYRPLDDATLTRYASQLPAGFRAVSKVWNEITSATLPHRGGRNANFLDPRAFETEVLAPIGRSFREHQGPLVLELPPIPAELGLHAVELTGRLDAFFSRVSKDFEYAVELRNRALLTERYLEVLERHGVSHVFNYWERMPSIGEQLDTLVTPRALSAPFVVSRLLVPPGERYGDRRRDLAPFDRIVDPRKDMRDDVVRLFEACRALGKVLYVIANNKAEGSSPLTVRALAERIADHAAI